MRLFPRATTWFVVVWIHTSLSVLLTLTSNEIRTQLSIFVKTRKGPLPLPLVLGRVMPVNNLFGSIRRQPAPME